MDKTLLKGLQVLDYIAGSDRNVRIADVATHLDLTKSNAYRALKTLEAAGYVKQDSVTKEFFASMKIWELGTQIINRFDLRTRAAEALRALADQSHETVHLAVLDGAEVVYIDKIDSSEPVAAYTRLAGRAPAHCVATGKALLSTLPESELTLRTQDLQRFSPTTITDPVVLRAELKASRLRGYAINHGEWRESVSGIAAVIRDTANSVVAAVGVSGPSYRVDDEGRSAALAQLVVAAADGISQTYGRR